MTAGTSTLSIDAGRLLGRIDELGRVGAIDGTTGCCRLALTDEDRAGRDLVLAWMRDLGLEVRIDGIGNVVGTTSHAPGERPVMTGSHIDTVATGGRYDGNLGVLAGLEVIETVLAGGLELRRPLAVGWFTDEEGSRFAPDMLGSLVYVGGLPLEEALDITDRAGAVLGAELDRIGYRGAAPCPGPAPHAFVELHIEQGPVLEDEGCTIGVVESVQGISWTEHRLVGRSCHAGTTPIALRRDPALVAARAVTFARDLCAEIGNGQVATVGVIDPHPNLVNVVPAEVTITIDLRNTDDDLLRRAERRLAEHLAAGAADEGVEVTSRALARYAPVEFDQRVVGLVERAADDLGLRSRRMPSGAGHDAQMLARVCPTGMIFVPSVDGISHNVAELTEDADIEAGANVLLRTMLDLVDAELG